MRVWTRRRFVRSRLFSAWAIGVLGASLSAGAASPALAQSQATQPFLLTVDACPVPGTSCSSGPTSQLTYLLQSSDGASWGLVPGFAPFEGGVAGIARRGNTVYIVTQAPPLSSPLPNQFSQMQTIRYHLDTGVQDPPVQFVVQDATYAGSNSFQLQDPSLALNAQGQLVLIYDVSTVPGPHCPSGVCHVRMATEIAGTDGTQFAQAGDLATYSTSSGGDPSAPFFDGSQWILYAGNSPPPPNPTAGLAFTSASFSGPYALYSGLPGAVSTGGLQVAGFFNRARSQYWNYLTTGSGTARVVKTSLTQQITGLDSQNPNNLVVSNATLGTSGETIQHPHLAVNWSGNPTVVASVLPVSRSVQVGNTATAFATMINTDTVNAADCYIQPATSIPANFVFQTTNPSTNAVTGAANTPVPITGNNGVQTFVFAVTPTAAFPPTNVQLTFGCASSTSATPISGVSTILLSGSATPVPDIVALAASGDPGIVDISSSSDVGAFAVATVNVGSSSAITASADTGGTSLPLSLSLCQTNPSTGACLAAASPSVTTTISANATPTFAIFAGSASNIPFDPANNRIFVRFTDGSGAVRGATSVAVRTQ